MGRLDVVGLGPGAPAGMTGEAREALEACDVVVGYTTYVDLVRQAFPEARVLSTPMRREVERCRLAFQRAEAGEAVCLVCSGDAGVYGMASPVLELARDHPDVEVRVVPGVTAALAASAALGAPLANDFACVSLSDILTPWDVIERRLRGCAYGDLCVALYNPRSSRRSENLARAAAVLLDAGVSPRTPCGWVRNVGRAGQASGVLELSGLAGLDADMFTTVVVGNTRTRVVAGRMVCARGYRELGDARGRERA